MMSARSPLFRWLFWMFLGAASVIIVATAWAYSYASRRVAALESRLFDSTAWEKAAPAVAADGARLGGLPVFVAADRSTAAVADAGDAGSFLNRRIAWSSGSGPRPAPAGAAAFDAAWWGELASFSYWDLDQDSPLGDRLAADPLAAPATWPQPDLTALRQAAEARLAVARGVGEPLSVLAEVQKLADLLLTTEMLEPVELGLSLYEQLVATRAELAATLRLPPDAPPLGVGDEDVRLARRHLRALVAYALQPGLEEPLVAQVFPSGQGAFGTCAATREAVQALHLPREILEPVYPEAFARADRVMAARLSRCRLHAARALWANRGLPAALRGDLFAEGLLGLREPPKGGGAVRWEELREWNFGRKILGLAVLDARLSAAVPGYPI